MILFKDSKAYATVWDVEKSESGKYIDLRITTSEKNQNDEREYSSWFARAIGHACNTLKDCNIKKNNTIIVKSGKFTNVRYQTESGEWRNSLKLLLTDVEVVESDGEQSKESDTNNKKSTSETTAKTTNKTASKTKKTSSETPLW